MDGENVLLFDADQILMVYFLGYQDLDEINQDFSNATYCGGAIWVGERFLYVRQMSSGKIIPVNEIESVSYNYAFGKLYYFLTIEAKEETVIQYHIDFGLYNRLQEELQKLRQ